MILILLIVVPFLAGLLAWAFGKKASFARWISLVGLAIDTLLVAILWFGAGNSNDVWLRSVNFAWIPQFGISFHLALDGLGLVLIALSVFLGIISVAVSWTEIQDRVGFFHFNLLTVVAGIIGVFMALDLILFYFFWEIMLVPMYFLIAIWGHENRLYAAVKFFLFTQIGSLFMLFAMVGLAFIHYQSTGLFTFDYFKLLGTPLTPRISLLLALGFLGAFAVKLPIFLLHTWLPDAHTEAPTAGSVILAGLLLKTGAYGIIRFVLPLFPGASIDLAPVAMLFGVLGIIYGAAMAFAQTDLKRLVAYSSVSHLGFVLIGIFAFNELALQGTVLQMVAHGVSTGALFVLVGMIQERIHTRDMGQMGGFWGKAPVLAGFAMLFALASLGLPGTANFAGEFLILAGVYPVSVKTTAFAAAGLVFSAVYCLWMMYKVFFGPSSKETLPDLSLRELSIVFISAVVIIWIGVHPQPILNKTAAVMKNTQSNMAAAHHENTLETRFVLNKLIR